MSGSKIVIGLLLTLIFISFSVAQVMASGVGFSPGRLEFDDNSKGMPTTLYVLNTGEETSNYRVYAEAQYEGWFVISPTEFSLDTSEHKPITISLSASDVPLGEHNAKICVVAFADTIDAKVGTGAKVPVHITITSPIPKPTEGALPELPIDTPESLPLTAEEATDSPVRVELWTGLTIVLTVVMATVLVFVRRRRSVGTQ